MFEIVAEPAQTLVELSDAVLPEFTFSKEILLVIADRIFQVAARRPA